MNDLRFISLSGKRGAGMFAESSMMENHWLQYDAEGFLSGLRDTSSARVACRELIKRLSSDAPTRLLEIGVGGLNERIALDDFLLASPHVSYTGADWTPKFVENGRNQFPLNDWFILNVERDHYLNEFDLIYSQHVLEHCGGLSPALPNMLKSTKKTLINIFFLPPGDTDEINFSKYPLYHNTYSANHISMICDFHGFTAEFEYYKNEKDPKTEVVLIATKR